MRVLSTRGILRKAGMPAAAAAIVLLVGGCGGGGDDAKAGHEAGSTTSQRSSSAAGVVLNLSGTEYSFAPTALTAVPGSTTIRFTNKGAMEHDFTIKALGVKLTAQPGKTAETTVTLTSGTYKTYCSVPGHRQSGMQGTLAVS